MAPIPGRADIRGYYAALGIELPAASGAQTDVPVPCFIDPGAHAHNDRSPSVSVSLVHGAYECKAGCGAGGAYDAALLRGRTPRDAIRLMIAYGLREDRPYDRQRRRTRPATLPGGRRRLAPTRPDTERARRAQQLAREFAATNEPLVRHAAARLAARPALLERLEHSRGWRPDVVQALGVGWLDARSYPTDRGVHRRLPGRVIFPVRDADGRLVGVRKYAPPFERGDDQLPKLLAQRGSRVELFPGPERYPTDPDRPMAPGNHIVLCEGEPDALAAISAGYAAVSIPGVMGWRPEWGRRFEARSVTIALDADDEGRQAAERIAADLQAGGAFEVQVWDPAPGRDDGYDLSDALADVRARRRPDIQEALLPRVPDGYDPWVDGPDEIRGRYDRVQLLDAPQLAPSPTFVHEPGELLAAGGLER